MARDVGLQAYLELEKLKTKIDNNKVEEWTSGTTFIVGKLITYQNKLYVCNTNHGVGEGASFIDVYWDLLSLTLAEDLTIDVVGLTADNVLSAIEELNTDNTTNQSNISNEANIRQGQVDILQTNIDNEQSSRISEIQSLRNNLASSTTGFGASMVHIEDANSNFQTNTVEGALAQLFTSVSNGKIEIATAITDQGGTASGSDTFTELSTAISNLPTGGGGDIEGAVNQITKLNVTAPYDKVITLSELRPIEQLCTSVLEFTPGATSTLYTCNFNNGDSSNFTFNNNYVTFNGTMGLKDLYEINPTNDGSLGDGTLYHQDIDKSSFQDIDSLNINEATLVLSIHGTPAAQVIEANGDIDLSGIDKLTGISLTKAQSGTGVVKIAVSKDSGVTYQYYTGSVWSNIDITNKTEFLNNGMNEVTLESLTETELEDYRGSATTLRFAYILDRPSYSDQASTDQINLNVQLSGTSVICDTSKYTLSYNAGTGEITYSFSVSGTYTMNYLY